jgi:dihydrofolate synthase / folylpolyglutamate synthase
MNRRSSITWEDFFSLQRFGMTPNLENILAFADHLGRPEQAFPSIHVAGTNGKGSVVATLSSILHSTGLKVGMYTSPHILKFNERIRIGEKPVSDDRILCFLENQWGFILSKPCTFFEVATAMAMEFFRQDKVDIAIVEVGLGGTYDSTQIVKAIISVITRIDYDHTDRLGNNLLQIAREKAGIIRPHCPVVLSDQQDDVVPVFIKRAAECNAPIFSSSSLVHFDHLSINQTGINGEVCIKCGLKSLEIESFEFPLTGSYQVTNLQTALATIGLLGERFPQLSQNAISAGLKSIQWQGRMQVLQSDPMTILDVGHNVGAIKATLTEIRRLWHPHSIRVIFSALRDKDVSGMMSIFRDEGITGFVIPLSRPRGLDANELKNLIVQSGWRAQIYPDATSALAGAEEKHCRGDLILAIGSHYLAEQILNSRNIA